MKDNTFIGWSGFALFVLSIGTLMLLMFSPLLEQFHIINVEAGAFVAGVLALLATIFGFVGFRTQPGKVAAIGGLVLVLILALVLPTSVSKSSPVLEDTKSVGQ